MDELTVRDLDNIIEALEFGRQRVQDYQGHPTYEFKRQRLDEISHTLQKVRSLRRALK